MSPREKPRTVPLRQLYTSADLSGIDHLDSLPGNVPFVRGPYPSMYTHKPWTIRQYTGYADAADSNRAFRAALQDGAQGLSVAFDLPTQRGYDSTDAEALADVGMAGVAIDTVEDMSGLELLDRLVALGAAPPTIFVSAFPSDALRVQVQSSTAITLLDKPVDAALLKRALGNVGI